MRILYAASEALPFAASGGLADVAGSLPKALCAAGHETCVVMQYHDVSSISILGNEYILHQHVSSSSADIHVKMGCEVRYRSINASKYVSLGVPAILPNSLSYHYSSCQSRTSI